MVCNDYRGNQEEFLAPWIQTPGRLSKISRKADFAAFMATSVVPLDLLQRNVGTTLQ